MSLKAKLEAVIYAAEEPVTLAQLAALFTADALEWKSEREAASAEQTTVNGVDAFALEPLPLLDQAFDYPEVYEASATLESAAEPPPESNLEAILAANPIAPELEPLEPGLEPGSDSDSGPEEEISADSEADLKRLARLRDREVRTVIRQLLDELIAGYASDGRGVEIREIAGGFRMATKPEYHDAVRTFVKSLKPALRLSLPALETLAVIAYKQPVTAPEVNEIRGVDSSGVFGSLLARKLITTAGRKPVIGRPILYKTTREFLLRFGLKDVAELPSMEEFEKMAAIELDEPELASTNESAPRPGSNPGLDSSLEFDDNDPQRPARDRDPDAAPELAELPVKAEAPEAEHRPQPSPADEPAEHEPANQAEPTPA